MDKGYINKQDRDYLRELAKRQLSYANSPLTEARKKHWYEHNNCKSDKPIIVIETTTFENEILPPLKCLSPKARIIERDILRDIINYELIQDDKVIPDYFTLYMPIQFKRFDMDFETTRAADRLGRQVGYTWKYVIQNIEEDLKTLKKSTFTIQRKPFDLMVNLIEDTVGDILPVKIKNDSLRWVLSPSAHVVHTLGFEKMMYGLIDHPDKMHTLYQIITDDILNFLNWQQTEGLLTLNNYNDYAGAGSYGFTDELPRSEVSNKTITTYDLWGNFNSQETVSISPGMFKEVIFPYYMKLAEKFGLIYYGCCEPVNTFWQDCLQYIPNLRKISISPWCNEEFMGDALRHKISHGEKIIYSRKPSPNFIGEGYSFDVNGFKAHIKKTIHAASGIPLEFIYRDVYTLSNNIGKLHQAITIIRSLTG